MTREELEEALEELLPGGFKIVKNKMGRINILTDLVEDEYGEIILPEDDEDIDLPEDEDLVPLEDEDEDDE